LRFTDPLKGGTLIVASETIGTSFSTSPINNGKKTPIFWNSNSISVIELPPHTSYDGFDFRSTKLRCEFLESRMINRGKKVSAPKMRFSLHDIHLLERRFANLAEFAEASATNGMLLRKSEKGLVGAFGLNDMKTEGFWRGEASRKGGTCDAKLTWNVPVTLEAVGVLIPWNNVKNMPTAVTVSGKSDNNSEWHPLVNFSGFDNRTFLGRKVYILSIPKEKYTELKFSFKARKKFVEIGELFAMGSSAKNAE
jgi:hypothetical protein